MATLVKRSKIWTAYSDTEFIDLVSKSRTFKEVVIACGIYSKGYNTKTVKARIQSLNISTDHFVPCHHNISMLRRDNKIPLSEILTKNSTFNRYHLKKRLLSENLISNICSECGMIDTWNNKPIILQLDHINGISDDNRLENLRLLCPNCHSQTITFAGRSLKKRYYCACGNEITKHADMCKKCSVRSRRKCIRFSLSELIQTINRLGYLQAGKLYGVSDNAVRKWLRQYGIDPKQITKLK